MAERPVTRPPPQVPPGIGRFINKTVMVSIPAVFDRRACRPCMLRGVEAIGLWLQSKELTARLLDEEARDLADLEPIVLVPFAQVLAIVTPTQPPAREIPRPSQSARRRRTAREVPAADQAEKPSRRKRSDGTPQARGRGRGTRGTE